MSIKRKICVITTTRAEYGLLKKLMQHIKNDSDLTLQLVVTGTHYSPFHGYTYKQIEADGFKIDYKVEMLLANDSPSAVTKSLGLASIGFSDAFEYLKPDIVVLLGDRFEIMAVAQAAMLFRIPIAHIHGGEITEGAIDDAVRHAITKMSHIHFVATEEYKQRVLQMGENPKFVFNSGAPGLDLLHSIPILSKEEFENRLNFKLQKNNFLITYHPVTLYEDSHLEYVFDEFLNALSYFNDVGMIFTKPNADVFGLKLSEKISAFILNKPNCKLYDSLGQELYFSALKYVDAVVGNSSSGLIEAPAMNVPTVDIGMRQAGRSKGSSVISANDSIESIYESLKKVLDPAFRLSLSSNQSPYGIGGNNSLIIKNYLKSIKLEDLLIKKFFSLL